MIGNNERDREQQRMKHHMELLKKEETVSQRRAHLLNKSVESLTIRS